MTPHKPFLAYFNKFHGEAYKKNCSKQFIQKTKIGYLNDKNVILKNNEKIYKATFSKIM